MAEEACRIVPHAFTTKNGKREEVESQLYLDLKELMSYVGKGDRATVLPLYNKTLDGQFNKDMVAAGALFDDNNEVFLYDFWKKMDNGKIVPEDALLLYLNEKNNFFSGKTQLQYHSVNSLLEKVTKFNDDQAWNRGYIAVIKSEGTISNPIFTAEIQPRTNENFAKSKKYKELYENGKYLRSSLKSSGIDNSYDRIDKMCQDVEYRYTNGLNDLSKIDDIFADVVELIKICKGISKKSIPENLGHFAVDLLEGSPLVSRAISQLDNDVTLNATLNTSDDVINYHINRAYDLREALGQIITGTSNSSPLNVNTVPRIKNTLNNVVSKLDIDGFVINDKKQPRLNKVRIEHTATKDLWNKFFEITLRRQNIYSKRKKELGISEDEDTSNESILSEQGKLLETLDIAANRDWSTKYTKIENGEVVFTKSKEEFRVNAAVQLMETAINDTERIMKVVDELRESINNKTYKGSMNSACARLRAIMDYLESYEQILTNFNSYIVEAFNDPSLNGYPEIDNIKQQLIEQAKQLEQNLTSIKDEVLPDSTRYDVKSEKKPLALHVFLKAIEDFIPEGAGLAIGTGINGEVLTLEEMMMYSDNDVLGITAWLNSMANTSDEVARIYDHIVKRQKDEARQEAIEIQREIKEAGEKLKKSGYKDRGHKFMYKQDNGKLIVDAYGRPQYITDYDMKAAMKAFDNYRKTLYKKYRGLPANDKHDAIIKDQNEWIAEHFERRRGETYPKKEYFPSKEYLSLTSEQREFYDTFMKLKRKCDSYIPFNTNDSTNAIIVRKDGLQKLLTISKDFKLKQAIKDWFGDMFKRKETDDEFGIASTITDFKGREMKKAPVYYRNVDKKTNLNNYSLNCVANLCIYAHTAANYKALAKVTETLELGRDILEQRRTHKKNFFGKPKMQNVREGGKIVSDYVYADQSSTNFNKRINNFMDMQVYGKLKEGKYSKHASVFSRIIGGYTTAINVFVGLTNIIQGIGQMNIEMFAGEYFTIGDLIKANKFYWSHILSSIADTSRMNNKSILSLFSEEFNVMQDWDTEIKGLSQYDKSKLIRVGSSILNPYILNYIGEHYMQHISFFAMANHTKIYDEDGNSVSLLDAYEAKEFFDGDKSLGSRLTLKSYTTKKGKKSQTYYTKDGKAIVTIEQLKARQESMKKQGKKVDLRSKALLWNKNEISEYQYKGEFARKAAKVNQDMHGIYNEDDKNQLQQKAYGSLFMMYRKHITPNFMKRYKSEWYDYDLDEKTSGYQRMLFTKLFKRETTDLDKKKWSMLVWTPKERANFMRNVGQLYNWITINLAITFMEALGGGDEDDNLWFSTLLVSLYRGKTENAQFEPLAIFSKHSIIEEWWRLAEQPVVGMSIVERVSNLVDLLDPESWTHIMKSGPYKGKYKWEKIVDQSIPGFNQVIQFKQPPLEYFRRDVGQEWFSGWMFNETY